MPERPFITCHALDTVGGKPAAGIAVELRLLGPTDAFGPWTARTDNNGRVSAWTLRVGASETVNEAVAQVEEDFDFGEGEQMVWSLTFETEAYFGKGKTFRPQVELRFATKKGEDHYHVPLLLGPWSYTTYRGS